MADSAPAMPEHMQTDTLARSRRAAASFRSASRMLNVLRSLLPGDEDVRKLTGKRVELEERFTRLTLVDRDESEFEETLERIENDVTHYGRELAELDAEIPMDWFRAHFDAAIASSESLADYAAIIGTHAGEDHSRLDRVQFLLTRVIRHYLGGSARVGTQLQTLLAEVLPPSVLDAQQRATAVQFFRDATRRMAEFTTLHRLISSGFFVDTRGYKLSMRRNILDPEVMAAVIELNEVMGSTIDRLAESEAHEGKDLQTHLAEVDERLRSLFKTLGTEDDKALERFSRRVARNQANLKKQGYDFDQFKRGKGKKKPATLRPWALAAAVLVCALILFTQSSGSHLTELGPNDTVRLSPLLVRAGVAPPNHPIVLIAEVDKTRWALMSADERHTVAAKLLVTMRDRGLVSATVMLENTVVIQIENGKLMIVQ